MPKTKEREAEKSSKSSTRASAKTSAKSAPAKPAAKANGASTPAKPSSKSSTKVPAVTTKPASGSHAKSAPQTKPPSASHAKPAAASSKATAPVMIAKPASSKSSGKIAVPAAKSPKSDRFEKALEKPTANLKTPFTKEELRGWREQLLQRRNEISSDIAGLEKDAMEAEDGHTTPNHIAERGSDADLQDVSLGIAGEEKDIIWQIDRALRKIDESSPLPFGLCEFTKEPISRNRLQLIPWTPLSIEGANYMEENGMKVEDLLVDG
jgi:DnaK suppressor protein